MLTVPKVFVRDFPVVLCQIWAKRYVHMFGQDVACFPRNIFVIQDGLAFLYRGPDTNKTINDILLQHLKNDSAYIQNFFTNTQVQIKRSETLSLRQLQNVNELKDFLQLIFECWEPHYISVYVPGDERFSREDRDRAMEFRKKYDQLEYKTFAHIDISLQSLFPEFGNLARHLTWSEITEEKIPEKSTLESRRVDTLYVIDGNVLDADAFTAIKTKENFELEKIDLRDTTPELKGSVACKGSAQGSVKKLLYNDDVKNFPEGAILVTSMTVPTFLPAMHKATAFVTDEGGITCHAAIVARELGKPCIIGTKHATSLLQNGDLVEVDAHSGVVRILERNSA